MRKARAKQPRGAETMERIVDAGLAAFAAQGLAGVTIEELSRRAEASVGSIYHHFGGREGVLAAVYRRAMASLLGAVSAAVLRRRTVRGGVEALVGAYLAWVGAHRDEARFVYAAGQVEFARGERDGIAAWKRDLVAPLIAWLAPFVRSGEVVALPEAYYEVVIIGPVAEFSRRWLSGVAGLDLDAAVPILSAAVRRALEPR